MTSSEPLILIVEDDEQTREYLASTLEADEAVRRVDRAATFDAGLPRISADEPDVMLVDLGQPSKPQRGLEEGVGMSGRPASGRSFPPDRAHTRDAGYAPRPTAGSG